jgi:hypothetical protein
MQTSEKVFFTIVFSVMICVCVWKIVNRPKFDIKTKSGVEYRSVQKSIFSTDDSFVDAFGNEILIREGYTAVQVEGAKDE